MTRTSRYLLLALVILVAGVAFADEPVDQLYRPEMKNPTGEPTTFEPRMVFEEDGPIDLPEPSPGRDPIIKPLGASGSFSTRDAGSASGLGGASARPGGGIAFGGVGGSITRDRVSDSERQMKRLIRRLDG